MQRRSFLGLAGVAAVNGIGAPAPPVIDSHIHLFDPGRPQGVPWPEKTNAVLYKTASPERYRKMAAPLGITGAIVVEASPWLEDNQWVLDVAKTDPIIVGVIGNLEPDKREFPRQLERFRKYPLFRGIRYGNLWGRDLSAQISSPEFMSGIRRLAAAGLTLDTANPNPKLISAVVRLTDAVPSLRVVIDHLPQMRTPEQANVAAQYRQDMKEIAKRPQIYVKISEVFRRDNGVVPMQLSTYRATLDEIYGTFGEDRVLYGSDWPNSDTWRPFEDGLKLVREYFQSKGPVASEKYFAKNSVSAYRWRDTRKV